MSEQESGLIEVGQDDITEVVETETENLETEEETEVEAESSEEENEQDENEEEEKSANSEEEEEKPRKNGFKKRIDKLNGRVTKAQQEADYWKQLALEKQNRPMDRSENQDVKKETVNEGRPHSDDFENQEDYIDALTEWKVDAKLQKREEVKAEEVKTTQRNQVIEKWQERVTEFSETAVDFDEVMEDAASIQVPNYLEDALLDSDIGPQMLYELAKDPTEAKRIINLTPIRAIRELGKFEAKLQMSSQKTKAVKTKTTKAKKPITPVRGSAKVSKSLDDPNLSQSEYEALRNKQIAG